MKSQAVTHPTVLSPTSLPLCGTIISTTGSINVFINKRPVIRNIDAFIPTLPVIPLVLPLAQVSEVARYALVSLGSTSVAFTIEPISQTFQWPLVTTPRPNLLSGSKTVFINKAPVMRVIDEIIPPTFKFKPEIHTVIVGG